MSYLKRVLQEKNISQAELGRRIGKSRSYINDYVSGRKKIKSLNTAFNIAIALGIDIGDFMKGLLKDE